MKRIHHILIHHILTLSVLMLAGCMSSDYVGKSYAPTEQVDLYMDEADVETPYEVMGEVRVEADKNMLVKTDKMQRKLMAMAREKGADAIILGRVEIRGTGVTEHTSGEVKKGKRSDSTHSTTTATVEEVRELRGTLIKYRKA